MLSAINGAWQQQPRSVPWSRFFLCVLNSNYKLHLAMPTRLGRENAALYVRILDVTSCKNSTRIFCNAWLKDFDIMVFHQVLGIQLALTHNFAINHSTLVSKTKCVSIDFRHYFATQIYLTSWQIVIWKVQEFCNCVMGSHLLTIFLFCFYCIVLF